MRRTRTLFAGGSCAHVRRPSLAAHVHACIHVGGGGVVAAYLARLTNLRCSRSLRGLGASANGSSACGPARGPCGGSTGGSGTARPPRRSICAQSDGSLHLRICGICQYEEMNALPGRGVRISIELSWLYVERCLCPPSVSPTSSRDSSVPALDIFAILRKIFIQLLVSF